MCLQMPTRQPRCSVRSTTWLPLTSRLKSFTVRDVCCYYFICLSGGPCPQQCSYFSIPHSNRDFIDQKLKLSKAFQSYILETSRHLWPTHESCLRKRDERKHASFSSSMWMETLVRNVRLLIRKQCFYSIQGIVEVR